MKASEVAGSIGDRIKRAEAFVRELRSAEIEKLVVRPSDDSGMVWAYGLTTDEIEEATEYSKWYKPQPGEKRNITPREARKILKREAKEAKRGSTVPDLIVREMKKRRGPTSGNVEESVETKKKQAEMGERVDESEWVGSGAKQIIDMIKANGGSVKGGNNSIEGKNQIIRGLNYLVEEGKLSK